MSSALLGATEETKEDGDKGGTLIKFPWKTYPNRH